MPKAKRAQVVHLTKTAKKTKDAKSTLISNVHATLHAHERVYAFSVTNMRNAFFQNIRQDLKPSCRIFYGKNRVMSHALTTVEHDNDKVKGGLNRLAGALKGQVGLLVSNMPHEELESYLTSVGERDFARAGCIATETITIPAGQLHQHYDQDALLPTTLEQQTEGCRDVRGGKGQIWSTLHSLHAYTICEEGATLSADQARLLKVFGVRMADFGMQLMCMCDMNTGAFEEYTKNNPGADEHDDACHKRRNSVIKGRTE